ncbi:ABC transporter ATP-binding protein [Nonomuraea sp. NPDC059007]|uniref:ABC transporter ATP-binding protein n=1 Tax=Nonomuraea sp. NPDC059007 TaxID=3346692 RepID=UPI0036C5C73E
MAWRAARWLTLGLGLLAVIGGVIPLTLAWLTKLVLDGAAAGRPLRDLISVIVGLAAMGILGATLPHLGQYLQREAERRIGLVAQDRLFRATEEFVGLSRFEDPAFADRLRLAQQHGGATPALVVIGFVSMGRSVLSGLSLLGVLLSLTPWLPLVVLLSALPSLAAELRHARWQAETAWRIGPTERRELFLSTLLTDAQAAKEIRLFGAGRFLRHRMLSERRKANAAKERVDRRELLIQCTIGGLAGMISGGALLWAVSAAVAGRISIGDVSLVIAALAAVQAAVVALVRDLARCHGQILLFGHYVDVLNAGRDLAIPEGPVPVGPLRASIDFKDVWFRYAEHQPWVLQGVSFTVPSGDSVAIVGRNGAGKSTIIKLLLRLYDPSRGAITWDGVDLRDIDPAALRQRVGAVFQDFMCYDLTAAENVSIADVGSAADDVVNAARLAGADDFIRALPHGYETMLSRIFFQGENAEDGTGVSLSGGQWQRMALARACLRHDRDLLILDEPSSGLDAEAEYEVHETLRRRRAGQSCVLISHRLGAVRHADRLIVIDQGRVRESGSHDELIRRAGLYARLFRMQSQGYTEAES